MKIFGKNPAGTYRQTVTQSVHFKDGAFKNLLETPMMSKEATPYALIRDLLVTHENRKPRSAIPSIKSDLYNHGTTKPVITWFGHSSYHITLEGKNILVDPVFSGNASPFSFMVNAFAGSDVYQPEDFSNIDILLLTHDHYDHLDYKTLVKLKNKVKAVCCSLGVASHLIHWGYDEKIITELDWWQSAKIENIKITAAPARHFSGRLIKRAQTLWSSFILEANGFQLYVGGDSGYGDHFIEIGKKFGSFDLALLECGQYNVKWPLIHMTPEETAQAALDLNAKMLMPVHWGKFALAFHAWNEPAIRVSTHAKKINANYTLPRIGEAVVIGDAGKVGEWYINI